VEETIRKVVAETGADTLVEKVSDMQAILSAFSLLQPSPLTHRQIRRAPPESGEIKQWLEVIGHWEQRF
jgi:hypothetical protein